MKLLVVILNYKSASFVVDCLHSLVSEVTRLPGTRVVITDNASCDGSLARIASAIREQGWSSWARLVPLERNGGYAFGNNAAIREALREPPAQRPDYVLLLNPDTVARPGALSELVSFMERNPAVGIGGSRLEEEDGTQHASRYRFHTIASEFESGIRLGLVTRLLENYKIMPPLTLEAHSIDWVAGASMIVRREVFEEVGLLDEGFFLYFEEVDFCLRANRAGWPCWYVPDSRVAHLVGKSSGVTHTKGPGNRRPTYWFASRKRYFTKNHGRLYSFAADLAWAVGFGLWRLRRRLQGIPDRDPPNLWWDFVRYNFLGGGWESEGADEGQDSGRRRAA